MVKLEPFHLEKWTVSHESSVKCNFASSAAPAISIQDLEALDFPPSPPLSQNTSPSSSSLAETTEHDDYNGISAILSRPMGYGNPYDSKSTSPTALLRTKIASMYSNNSSHPVHPKNVIATVGGSLANFMVFYALVGPGDHIIVHYPTYQQLTHVPASLGAEVSLWKTNMAEDWRLNVDELKLLIRPNTKMIVLNTPQNPTGAFAPRSMLEDIVRVASEHNIILFVDEIFSPINLSTAPSPELPPPPALHFGYKNMVTTSSLSKAYSLPGIRVGWIVSHNPSIIEACHSARAYCFIGGSQVDEHLAGFALEPARVQSILRSNTALVQKNIGIVQSFIDRHASVCAWVRPTGGNISFVQFSRAGKPIDDAVLCTRLYEKKSVLLAPGSPCFGGGVDFLGFARLGFGLPTATLQAGLDALSEFIKEEWEYLPLAEEKTTVVS